MKHFVLTLLISALVAPAFATTETNDYVDANADTNDVALERGLIPAELLDSSEFQTEENQTSVEALFQRGPGRPGPGRPGPGQPPGRPGPGRPEPQREWRCEARNRQGRVYTGIDRDQNRARREAVQSCERRSRRGDCRLIGCRR